jgi:tripartite-type tricarboxylate transporter receptor subunit TctC
MNTSLRILAVLAFAVAGVLNTAAALAQTWPTKPVRLINPFPAGGGVDAFGRPLAAKLSLTVGQQFFVENQAGAGGTVGANNASKATPDGYTFFLGAVHHTIAESLYTKLPYNIERDFVPVTVLSYVPNVVVVHPKHPFKTLKELIDYAKANPGKLNFGSAGNGTSHHLAGELFKTLTGTQLTHVPYKGAGPMMQDLIAGQVDLAFDGMGTSAQQIKGGKLRPLAVTTLTRSPLIPDVPTMAEAGVPGYDVTTWYALWAIKGTPQAAIDRMYSETVKVLAMPDIKEIWAAQGADAGGQRPEEFAQLIKREIVKWAKVVKEAGAQVDL